MAKRESVMLAQTWDKRNVVGWFMSEKLDGHRAWWDGGVTRGMVTVDVPWANIDKDKKLKIATGLWTRKAKPIYAPGWFLDSLPKFPLDGELYIGRGKVQQLASTIRKENPVDWEWRAVKYHIFESPGWADITNTDGLEWTTRPEKVILGSGERRMFLDARPEIEGPHIELVKQHEIKDMSEIDDALCDVVAQGGEGLMLRNPNSIWTPIRSWNLLKVKKPQIGEGTVIGFNWAREGKLEGLMGCLQVQWSGKTFYVSGFTDRERVVIGGTWSPGGTGDGVVEKFPIGKVIKFTYREKTVDGAPKEARYLR